MLLERDKFREGVFERDSHKCVMCDAPAQDAHHIIERRLFTDGGYYLDNGSSLCGEHHLAAEYTTLSPQEIREKIGITKVVLPEHLYRDQEYDKWGNPMLPNGTRLKGDLFDDLSVQKALKAGGVLGSFTHLVKYPRTYHVMWSPGLSNDDRAHNSLDQFEGKNVVVHLKMDGENASFYNDHYHARSLDTVNHPSRKWAKMLHARIMGDIPESWRVCAENLYAEHSIHYDDLEAFVLAFSIWNEKNECLGWDETQDWFELLEVPQVPVLYEGLFSEEKLHEIESTLDFEIDEGYVMRTRDSFHYNDFRQNVAKYVRKGHVQHSTEGHWINRPITPNELRK